ncbi:MAG TPA: cytochrome P460 family protein [Candidatus Limnocylindrales bacterium]|nr:cytochrome P460 family protein [Candidatus Limnocylindrales bacterium]
MKRRSQVLAGIAIVAGAALAVSLAAGRTDAGADKIKYPAACKVGTLYTIADRYDVKQYRELYTTPAAVEAAKAGKPLPPGTVITLIQYKAQVDAQGNPLKDARGRFLKGDPVGCAVMEKQAGWGAEYPVDLRNGEWEYSAFSVDGKFNDKANYKGCFQCHKPHEDKDYVISYPAMAGRTQVASLAPVAPGAIPVGISAFTFGPGGITIAPGKTVTWTNSDDSPHQVTVAGTKLRTEFLLKGQSASLTFPNEGVFSYNCALHPNMKGSVEVKK